MLAATWLNEIAHECPYRRDSPKPEIFRGQAVGVSPINAMKITLRKYKTWYICVICHITREAKGTLRSPEELRNKWRFCAGSPRLRDLKVASRRPSAASYRARQDYVACSGPCKDGGASVVGG